MPDGSMFEDLGNGVTKRQLATALSPRIQELIILPTEKCNLRCTYCYEDFAIGRMKESTQLGLERLMARRVPDLTKLAISWFGGEPLTAQAVVLRLSKYAHELCLEHGTDFSGGLTTNAYLLDFDLFEELVSYRQNFYQITLDGWGSVHDEVRNFANRKGTFDRIWSNLLAMKNSTAHFEIILRIHVRRENIDSLPILMVELARAFGSDKRFRLDFEHLRDLGGSGGQTVKNGVKIAELYEIEAHLRKVFKEAAGGAVESDLGEEKNLANLVAKVAGESAGGRRAEEIALNEPYVCYAAKANSLLIRANGRIGKCTVAFSDERNDIGQVNTDGTISIDNEKLQPWIRGLGTLDLNSLACPLQKMSFMPSTHVATEAVV